MPIIAVVTDLIFSTKITGTAKALGREVKVARTITRLEELLAVPAGGEGAPAAALTVIVDLNANGIDVMAAVKVAKAKGAAVVAYLSHVQVDLATAARDAGADRVMARSAFVQELPGLLGG